ncbi:MAG: sugar ABC transporter permease [Oscillospiraceae bacterium]|nr:sugar ABC transporter permease [Oscillospiraceae bacterium]
MAEKQKQKKPRERDSVSLIHALTRGSWPTKTTALISGFGCLIYGQFARGLLYLAVQILTLAGFISFGWQYVRDFATLGTREMTSVLDPIYQIPINVPGDNSLQILLYSVFAFALLAAGLAVHLSAVKAAYAAETLIRSGKRPAGFRQDLRDLLDKNVHTTMLSLPVLGVAAFTALPIIFMILLAFTNFDRLHQPPGNLFTWVGMQNFTDMLSLNGVLGNTFIRILGWTLIWAVFATFLNYFFGMIVALMINKQGIRLKSLWRTCFVIAIAVPGFVTLLFMRQLLGDLGPINTLLQSDFMRALGFSPVQFLRDPGIARVTVIVVNLWIGIPYTMLITSGILMNIPADLFEAARIDGAGPVRQFRSITLPYMLAVTAPYLITQFIGNINNFNAIFFLTGGGPPSVDYYHAGKTDLLVTWLYSLTVTRGDYNLASVIGIITFLLSAAMGLIAFNITASAKKEETFR